MNIPNWLHNSGKEQKRKLKPQALRDARRRKQALKAKLMGGGKHPSHYFHVVTPGTVVSYEFNDSEVRGFRMHEVPDVFDPELITDQVLRDRGGASRGYQVEWHR